MALLGGERAQHALDPLARTPAGIAQRLRLEDRHAALVEQPEQQPFARQGRVDEFVVLHRTGQGLALGPAVVLGRVADEAGRRVAGIEIDLPATILGFGEELRHQPAGPPMTALAGHVLGDRQTDQGRDLFGLDEVLMGRRLQPLALERHDALVARHLGALVDRQGQMALAQQFGRAQPPRRIEPRRVEAREGSEPVGRGEIHHQHVDDAVGLGLQLETALDLECRPQERRQGGGFADQARHGIRIAVLRQDMVDRRPEPDDPAADVERRDREGQDQVVVAKVGDRAFETARSHARAPRHQARMPFWACRRFSASSKTTDCGPSITSSVTSSPRCAGRQCMNRAFGSASAINRALT